MTSNTPTVTDAGVVIPGVIMVQMIADAAVTLHARAEDIETISDVERSADGYVIAEDAPRYGVALANLFDEVGPQTVSLTVHEMRMLASQIFDRVGTGTTGYERRPF